MVGRLIRTSAAKANPTEAMTRQCVDDETLWLVVGVLQTTPHLPKASVDWVNELAVDDLESTKKMKSIEVNENESRG